MPLESAIYISDLNSANPLSTDSVSQSDDHIRLIKAAIKATFPNVTAPVTATASQLNSPVPQGVIVMWSGSLVSVPAGWALCDGTNGTPNLRDRFVIGAGTTFAVGATGGSTTTTSAGGHTHTELAAGSHNHSGVTGDTTLTVDQIPAHSHSMTAVPTAGTGFGYTGLNGVTGTNVTSTNSTGGGMPHNHGIGSDGSHTHSINAVGDHTHSITPPYFALAYIMKI